MAKKMFTMPILSWTPPVTNPPDDIDTGAGSAQSGKQPWACSYADWLVMYARNIVPDGDGEDIINETDYVAWWYEMGFSAEAYAAYNGGAALPPDPRP